MAAGHVASAGPVPAPRERTMPTSLRDRATTRGALRILLAERQASAHSELSRRLQCHGHEVLARVTSAQGAIDYAGFLTPDVVLVSPLLEDAVGLTVAMTLARQQPGVAAVVLTTHPAAADPASRPNWGSVALLAADAEADDIHAELWRAVKRAREAAGLAAYGAVDAVAETEKSRRSVAAPNQQIVMGVAGDAVAEAAPDTSAAEAEAIAEMVDALYPSPDAIALDLAPTLVSAEEPPADPVQENDAEVVARATAALVERAHLTRVMAMRLMEQEAADSTQSIADVAAALLLDDASDLMRGATPAA